MADVDFVRADWHTARRRPGLNQMHYLYLIIQPFLDTFAKKKIAKREY